MIWMSRDKKGKWDIHDPPGDNQVHGGKPSLCLNGELKEDEEIR